jgi:hypothetical protein
MRLAATLPRVIAPKTRKWVSFSLPDAPDQSQKNHGLERDVMETAAQVPMRQNAINGVRRSIGSNEEIFCPVLRRKFAGLTCFIAVARPRS